MKHKLIFKLTTSLLVVATLSSLQGCVEKDKQMVLTNDIKEDIDLEENEINDLISKGTVHLNSSEFDEAKECYEKAISLDITKESTYLSIKDTYINVNRYDDAYYIIQLAIDNNVSRESMDILLKDIQSYFSPTLITVSIYRGDSYTLPSKVNLPINNVDTETTIRWNTTKIDTSNLGTFNFEGYSDEYGRTVNLSLKVSEKPIYSNKENTTTNEEKKVETINSSFIGYIKDIYDELNNTCIVFDEVQYFDNADEVQKEYLKDNAKANNPELEFGNIFYIRNTSQDTKTYKLSSNSTINLCAHAVNTVNTESSADLVQVSMDTFKDHINNSKPDNWGMLLFKIKLSNDIISDITMMYIP